MMVKHLISYLQNQPQDNTLYFMCEDGYSYLDIEVKSNEALTIIKEVKFKMEK